MESVAELDEVLRILAGALLLSSISATVEVLREAFYSVSLQIKTGGLVCGRVLLTVVHADAYNLEGFLFCPVYSLLAEHVVDHLVHADAEAQPQPAPLPLVQLSQELGSSHQLRAQPLDRHVSVVHMHMQHIRTLLHLPQPHHDRGVRVLRRVEEVEHLEVCLVSSDERRLDVLQLVLSFSISEELTDLIQKNQLDRLALVDDALGVVNTVRSGEVDGVPVRLVCDLHRADCDLEGALRDPQPFDGSLDLLVDRLPQFVVTLS